MADNSNPLIKARDAAQALSVKISGALGGADGARDQQAAFDAFNRGDILTDIKDNLKVDGDMLANARNAAAGLASTVQHNLVHTSTTREGALDFLEKSTLGGAGVKLLVDEVANHGNPSAGGAKPITPASKTPGK